MQRIRFAGWLSVLLMASPLLAEVECPCWSVEELLELPRPQQERTNRCYRILSGEGSPVYHFEFHPSASTLISRSYHASVGLHTEGDGPGEIACYFNTGCSEQKCETIVRYEALDELEWEVCQIDLEEVGRELGFTCFDTEDE